MKDSGRRGHIGFLPLLALLFIGLKLGHVISWSWFWVLSPIWGMFAFVGLVVAAGFILALALLVVNILDSRSRT